MGPRVHSPSSEQPLRLPAGIPGPIFQTRKLRPREAQGTRPLLAPHRWDPSGLPTPTSAGAGLLDQHVPAGGARGAHLEPGAGRHGRQPVHPRACLCGVDSTELFRCLASGHGALPLPLEAPDLTQGMEGGGGTEGQPPVRRGWNPLHGTGEPRKVVEEGHCVPGLPRKPLHPC